jgi:chaperonin GroES
MIAKAKKAKLNPASPAGRLKPTAGYLVLEPVEAQTKTDSGIYLPESAEEKPQKGTVVAIGPDEITEKGTKRTSPAKVGDVVIYKKWGGNEVKIDEVEYLFAKFEDILAVVTA